VNKYGDRGLWRLIPTVAMPFNPAYRSVWGLMTRREKQVSFLIDMLVILLAGVFGWLFA
jgi:hypothetical protein